MFKVLAQDGTTQLHLEGAGQYRTLRVSSTEPLEALAITLAAEDLPGIALGLLKGNPHMLTHPHLSAAVKMLAAYVTEQKVKQEEAKLRERRDTVLSELSGHDDVYDSYPTGGPMQQAVDLIIDLQDKLEAGK